MENIPLSIIVLTNNEADNINRCLTSAEVCDEVILLDCSTDDTVDIAKKLLSPKQLLVEITNVNDDFASLRNRGLDLARNEWVFFLDADEVLTSELEQEIREAILDEDIDGYFIKREDYFLGKTLRWGEIRQVKLLKLGKKSAGNWYRRVHEVWDIKGKIGELKYPLLHFPHPTVAEFLTRINRWTTLDAQEFYAQGIKSSFWKIIIFPKAKFILNYIVKFGFLDGMPGLIFALIMSFHSFLTRAKLYELQTSKKSNS